MTDELQEAHAPAAFHERVSSLHQGEVARLQGGVAVARVSTQDGRDGFRVARSYGSDRTEFPSYGDFHRTAEDATRAAFRTSASSDDPESIGGSTRLSTYGPVEYGGTSARVSDFTTDGKAVVALSGGVTRTVDPGSLSRPTPSLIASEDMELMPLGEEWSEASRAAALAKRKAEHPDWNWGRSGDVLSSVRHIDSAKDAKSKGITFKKVPAARGEVSRHAVYHEGTHVGHVAQVQHAGTMEYAGNSRIGIGHSGAGKKWRALDVNGREAGGVSSTATSRLHAVRDLGRHLQHQEVRKQRAAQAGTVKPELRGEPVRPRTEAQQRNVANAGRAGDAHTPSEIRQMTDSQLTSLHDKYMRGDAHQRMGAAAARELKRRGWFIDRGRWMKGRVREAHETLDRSPRKNWVEKRGGLPQAIVHMAKDIHEERGLPLDQAIPIAISQAKKLAAKGNAKYAAAVAQWEKMKAQEGLIEPIIFAAESPP